MQKTVLFGVLLLLLKNVINEYVLPKIELDDFSKSMKTYTAEELAAYDGSDAALPLLMSVRGVVFDVTTGKGFYGKGKSYNALIGKDATRAVAKMSLEAEDLVSDISGLSTKHLQSLQQVYESVYLAKYPVVGIMDYLKEASVQQHKAEDL